MIIAERLKLARKECKLTQQQVADLLGLDRSTYSYYELGTICPSIEALATLSAIFGVDYIWLSGADKANASWSTPEYPLGQIKAAKENSMGQLTKEERRFVALLRAARAVDKDADIFNLLAGVISGDSDEE